MTVRHPPGRAGRLWLVERLDVARRAGDILEHKQQALRLEERRLAHLVERSATALAAAVSDAETWQRRAMVLGGRPGLETATRTTTPAEAEFTWKSEMGVRYPGEATCELGPPPDLPGPSALTAAAREYRRALTRAVEHAAASDALERFRTELGTTEQRLHAVRDRWIPRLEDALDDLELRLDEHEREELVRTRFERPRSLTTEP